MSASSALIETSHLVKKFGEKLAVNDVTFSVNAGEVFGFLGPNGAGKTTTIKAIVGLLQPTSGTVKVAGYDVQLQPMQAKAASGYVPDTPNLYMKLSARELLRFVGDLYELKREKAEERIDELLRLFDLADVRDDLIDSYSHGMKQKAALAAALIHDPKVLVLDEPTVGLDPVLRRDLWATFADLAATGVALLVSSHVMEEAEHCDELLLMREGRLLANDSPDGLRGRTGRQQLDEAFLALIEEQDA